MNKSSFFFNNNYHTYPYFNNRSSPERHPEQTKCVEGWLPRLDSNQENVIQSHGSCQLDYGAVYFRLSFIVYS